METLFYTTLCCSSNYKSRLTLQSIDGLHSETVGKLSHGTFTNSGAVSNGYNELMCVVMQEHSIENGLELAMTIL